MRVVIFHYNRQLREELADTLRQDGYVAYAAVTPADALRSAIALKPDIVATDFPALIEGLLHPGMTLAEAIKAHRELQHVAVVSLGATEDSHIVEAGKQAGICAWLPIQAPPAAIAAHLRDYYSLRVAAASAAPHQRQTRKSGRLRS